MAGIGKPRCHHGDTTPRDARGSCQTCKNERRRVTKAETIDKRCTRQEGLSLARTYSVRAGAAVLFPFDERSCTDYSLARNKARQFADARHSAVELVASSHLGDRLVSESVTSVSPSFFLSRGSANVR